MKVFFDITVGEGPEEYDIEFNFENESLKHRMDSTMRADMFQVRPYWTFTNCYFLNNHCILFLCNKELDRPRSREQT